MITLGHPWVKTLVKTHKKSWMNKNRKNKGQQTSWIQINMTVTDQNHLLVNILTGAVGLNN